MKPIVKIILWILAGVAALFLLLLALAFAGAFKDVYFCVPPFYIFTKCF